MDCRITLLVLAFEQARFIENAVRSALAQVCEPIEIILSDDASSDDTYARMQALASAYQGPHRVVLNRNGHNLGIGAHYNRLIERARGSLLVTQAGDDISVPHRVARVAQAWDQQGQRPDLIASHLLDLDETGQTHAQIRVDPLERWSSIAQWAAQRPHVVGAAHAFTKRLHQRFGPYLSGLTYEDQVNTLRAIGSGGAYTINEALVLYRRGGISGAMQRGDGAAFMAWSRRRNASHLALHAQWLTDAQTMGVSAQVSEATSVERECERYLQALLQARNSSERWRCAWTWPALPAGWRLRKALHLSWPALAARKQALRR